MTGPPAAAPAAAPDALHAPPAADVALIVVAVAAVSTSGPLIAATAAPALAIAFWRNAMASGLLVPWSLARGALRGLGRRERALTALAGGLLAAHFATWVPSVTMTSVASSTALVATQPIWAALIARRRGAQIPFRAWAGIGVAVLGAAVVTGADVAVSGRALAGDALALAGAVFAAAYVTAGGVVRRTASTTAYTTGCYLVAALVLLVITVAHGDALAGYPAAAWGKLAALTVGAQLLGHSVFNRVLRTTSPTVVSLSILFEVPGAALIAGLWLGQRPPDGVFPGLVLLVAGIALVVTSRRTRSVAAA